MVIVSRVTTAAGRCFFIKSS